MIYASVNLFVTISGKVNLGVDRSSIKGNATYRNSLKMVKLTEDCLISTSFHFGFVEEKKKSIYIEFEYSLVIGDHSHEMRDPSELCRMLNLFERG